MQIAINIRARVIGRESDRRSVVIEIRIPGARVVTIHRVYYDVKRGRKIGVLLRRIGRLLMESIRRRYLAERDPKGHPWRQLSPAYKAWKESKYPGRKKLQLTRDMFRSLDIRLSVNRTNTKGTLLVGMTDPKAPYHQLGTRTMPARPFLGVTKRNLKAIDKMVMQSAW